MSRLLRLASGMDTRADTHDGFALFENGDYGFPMTGLAEKLDVRIDAESLTLVRYPFMKHNRGRTLFPEALSEVVVGWAPPCVRTTDAEFLFVPADRLEALSRFALEHDIPFKRRVDIWSMILDPFLDTELDDDYRENSATVLAEHGVSDDEVEEMRRLVATRMRIRTYNTWEWTYYGLFDVLDEMSALTFTTGWAFDRFYDHALALADRGSVEPSTPDALMRTFVADTDPIF